MLGQQVLHMEYFLWHSYCIYIHTIVIARRIKEICSQMRKMIVKLKAELY